MRLDIVVYRNAHKVERPNVDYPQDEGYIQAFAYEGFERSMRGLEDGAWYEAEFDHSFRAGSYGGYNRWRRDLSQRALGVSPETVWAAPDDYADKPFFELINFADNEGTIGPEAAADLAEDFARHADIIDDADDDFAERYREWRHAFEVAAGHGIVEFG